MTEVVHVANAHDLARLIREDQERLQMDVKYGIVAAAKVGQRVVRSTEPVDTGKLRRETVVEEFPEGFASSVVAKIVVTSPYAAAEEAGTRPFTPPFEAILAWAMRQAPNIGFGANVKAAKAAGREVAKAITAARAGRSVAGKRGRDSAGRFTSGGRHDSGEPFRQEARAALDRKVAANKPIIAFARAVWNNIRRKGIKAKWYMRDAQPRLRKVLASCVARAVRDHKPAGGR